MMCAKTFSFPLCTLSGLPFAGLDEFVQMSDFIGHHLDPGTLHALDASPLVGGKFSNFLNVRSSDIRLVPNNCWTREFAVYLQKTSFVAKVCHRVVYGTSSSVVLKSMI